MPHSSSRKGTPIVVPPPKESGERTRPYEQTGEKLPMVILGGGMAGSTILIHTLLKAAEDPALNADNPLPINLIERFPQQLYGGIAYGKTTQFDHRLNLAAWRVTPFEEGKTPEGFPTFEQYIEKTLTDAGKADEIYDCLTNPPRHLYSDYLNHLVGIALAKAGDKVKYETITGQVTDFHETSRKVALEFSDGRTMDAGHLVLTTGFKDAFATSLRSVFNVRSNPAFLDYPYSDSANGYFKKAAAQSTENSTCLVMGTGLTAIDTAHRLLESGFRGKIVMASRRGMTHPLYLEQEGGKSSETFMEGEPRPSKEPLLNYTRTKSQIMLDNARFTGEKPKFSEFKDAVVEDFLMFKELGCSNEEILTAWEKYVPVVYNMYPEESIKFFLDNETLINVMRVGTVPGAAKRLHEAIKSGQLEISTMGIDNLRADGKKLQVAYTPYKDGKPAGLQEKRNFDYVISGIGNSTTFNVPADEIKDPLWKNLRARDAYMPHPLYAGLDVTDDFYLKDGENAPYRRVTAVGALISGHMTVTNYPYPEKEGSGGRLGPYALNIQGITGAVLAFTQRNYDTLREQTGISQASPYFKFSNSLPRPK